MELSAPIRTALRAQLAARQSVLDAAAERVGWKVAKSIPGVEEQLGPDGTVFGYLTGATVLPPGGVCRVSDAVAPHAETELTVYLRQDVEPGAGLDAASAAIGGVGVAIEIVDVDAAADMHEVIADNVYHRAVAFGPVYDVTSVQGGRRPRMTINGVRQEATAPLPSLGGTVAIMAELLDAVGERLRAGDRMICGSLTHCPVVVGDRVTAGIDGLGGVSLDMVRPLSTLPRPGPSQ